jgi:hypothetical protein
MILFKGFFGQVSIYSSVVAEKTGNLLELTNVAASDLDCLIVNDGSTLTGGTHLRQLDFAPFFVDVANGDYHLLPTPDNPAIDFCDDAVAAPEFADIDLEARGVDQASVPDGLPGGFWDLGADEVAFVPEPGAAALAVAALLALAALGSRGSRT